MLTGMARYGIPSTRAVGVSVGTLKKLSAELGKQHDLALGRAAGRLGWVGVVGR